MWCGPLNRNVKPLCPIKKKYTEAVKAGIQLFTEEVDYCTYTCPEKCWLCKERIAYLNRRQ